MALSENLNFNRYFFSFFQLDRRGNIKLCDFGISGKLVDSIAKTRDAGCRPYMAPERIDPQRARGYDVRSDVWSLGITLIEISTGRFPYRKWNSVFDQLQQVWHFFGCVNAKG